MELQQLEEQLLVNEASLRRIFMDLGRLSDEEASRPPIRNAFQSRIEENEFRQQIYYHQGRIREVSITLLPGILDLEQLRRSFHEYSSHPGAYNTNITEWIFRCETDLRSLRMALYSPASDGVDRDLLREYRTVARDRFEQRMRALELLYRLLVKNGFQRP